MNKEAELLNRIAVLEDRLPKLRDRVLELEQEVMWLKARPQPATPIGGAGSYWPWPTVTGAIGSTSVMECSPGAVGSAENPLIVKDR
jgi:hypothetical protein